VGNSLPPEFVRENRLTLPGAKGFLLHIGHKISSLSTEVNWDRS
jgi:hypothetical protein